MFKIQIIKIKILKKTDQSLDRIIGNHKKEPNKWEQMSLAMDPYHVTNMEENQQTK